jgi:hypothetical protein
LAELHGSILTTLFLRVAAVIAAHRTLHNISLYFNLTVRHKYCKLHTAAQERTVNLPGSLQIINFRKIRQRMPTAQSISNDWLTVKQSISYCNISRSRLYSLREEPMIRTMSLRRRGRTRGIRYFSQSSLDSFFNQQADSQVRQMAELRTH